MHTFKTGDIVRHIEGGHIGRVTDTTNSDWDFCNDVFAERHKQFIQVRFFDLKKRYGGLYEATSFEHYTYPNTMDMANTVTDWLSTPKEKLRNVLAAKILRTNLNQKRHGKMRMDGRR